MVGQSRYDLVLGNHRVSHQKKDLRGGENGAEWDHGAALYSVWFATGDFGYLVLLTLGPHQRLLEYQIGPLLTLWEPGRELDPGYFENCWPDCPIKAACDLPISTRPLWKFTSFDPKRGNSSPDMPADDTGAASIDTVWNWVQSRVARGARFTC